MTELRVLAGGPCGTNEQCPAVLELLAGGACTSSADCPAVLAGGSGCEHENCPGVVGGLPGGDGRVLVIGADADVDAAELRAAGAGVGPGETAVWLPVRLLLDAADAAPDPRQAHPLRDRWLIEAHDGDGWQLACPPSARPDADRALRALRETRPGEGLRLVRERTAYTAIDPELSPSAAPVAESPDRPTPEKPAPEPIDPDGGCFRSPAASEL